MHVALAQGICREISLQGDVPIAPHLLYPQFLDDGLTSERKAGIRASVHLLGLCDEVYVYRILGISDGMRHEIDKASELKKKITYIDWTTNYERKPR